MYDDENTKLILKCANCGEYVTVERQSCGNFLWSCRNLSQHRCNNGEVGILAPIKTDKRWKNVEENKKMFTKKDLKTGMVVEFKNGKKFMVLTGNFKTDVYGEQSLMFLSSDGFNVADNWDNKLNFINGSSNERHDYDEYDVIAVYSPCITGVDNTIASSNESNLIWHREDEVDWSKIAVDTKVLVRDIPEQDWMKRYFAGVNSAGHLTAFRSGKTSFTCCGAGDANVWKEMVLYEGNENLVEESK